MAKATLTQRVEVLERTVGDLATRADIGELRGELREAAAALRKEIRESNDETRRHMLVLHEEVMDRMKIMDEGRDHGRLR